LGGVYRGSGMTSLFHGSDFFSPRPMDF